MYKSVLLPFLFRFDAERVHHWVCGMIQFFFKIPGSGALAELFFDEKTTPVDLFGLRFKNAVGLAAGFDKNAEMVDAFAHMGFGFVEIGTVTPRPQTGNPLPRLFRLKPDEALVNRMGFNNLGVKAAAQRLRARKSTIVVGGNIGKNKDTPNENALDDYLICFRELFEVVDYFVVNVSSPNTPGLRDLQEKEPLIHILGTLQRENESQPTRKAKPILLKIAPDLTNSQLDDIVEIVQSTRIAGVIATNTTINRNGLRTAAEQLTQIGAGGLSGKPLAYRSTEVIRYLCQKSNGAFPVIGVGGVSSPSDALEKIQAGASLVQIYTGFIYEGPGVVKSIVRGLRAKK